MADSTSLTMYKNLSDFVDKNLTDLMGSTTEIFPLTTLFVGKGLISSFQREDIEDEGTESRQARKLWNILKKKDDEDVPVIINCLNETCCAKSVARSLQQYLESRKASETPNPAGSMKETSGATVEKELLTEIDFTVSEGHLSPIAYLLDEKLTAAEWEAIKRSLLTTAMVNAVGKQDSVKLDIQRSIDVWIRRIPSNERLFSKIIQVCERESLLAAEALRKNIAEWKKITE